MTAQEILVQQRAAWPTSGARLVQRILIRRRLKCQRARTHTPGRCRTCGVHQ